MASRGKRSRNGCLTCRARKVKCDELHPVCSKCTIHRFSCDWPTSSCNDVTGSAESRVSRRPAKAIQNTSMTLGPSYLGLHPNLNSSPCPSLKEPQMQCSNSLTLTTQDMRLWNFFPSTALFFYYDFGECSSFRYLFTELTRSSSAVMSMVLAVSASEMRRRGLRVVSGSSGNHPDDGIRHYSVAINHLNSRLSRYSNTRDEQSVEELVGCIFFMVNYELQFPSPTSAERIKAHLRGLWALVNSHPIFQGASHDEVAPEQARTRTAAASLSLSCQIILWCIYLDISMTILGASGSLVREVASSSSPILEWQNLCAVARRSNSHLWGDKYSPNQRVADMDFCRPMHFGYETLVLRFRIWDFKTNTQLGSEESTTAKSLLSTLLHLKEKYADMLSVVDAAQAISWKKSLGALLRVATFYWATLLFYCRIIGDAEIDAKLRRDALTKLTNTIYILRERDSNMQLQARISWPTFVAAIETSDPIHRLWLLTLLRDCRDLNAECSKLCAMAEETLELQGVVDVQRFDAADTLVGSPYVI